MFVSSLSLAAKKKLIKSQHNFHQKRPCQLTVPADDIISPLINMSSTSGRPTGPRHPFPCRRIIFFALGSILMQVVCGENSVPKFPFQTDVQNITVHKGATATFNCAILSSYASGWNHKDMLVFLNGKLEMDSDHYGTVYSGPNGDQQMTIKNVSLEDDGPVDCITMWGKNDEWSKSRGYLTVLVPPSDVVIITQQAAALDSGIIRTRMDEMVNLTCVAQGGRPVPKLVWFHRSRMIQANVNYSMLESKTSEATYSSLLFRATSADNGDFTCQAESPALVKPNARTVQLDVLYPPLTPVISQGTQGVIATKGGVREGSLDFSLTCETKDGNPTPRLTWFRNGHQEEGTIISNSHMNTRGGAMSALTFTPRKSDNGAILKCEAVNELMPRGISTEVVLDVWFGPSSVSLKSPSEVSPNSTFELRCDSGPSNPPADISWTINGTPYREKSSHTQPALDGAFVTTSTVKLALKPNDYSDIAVVCQAFNAANSELSKSSITIEVRPKLSPGSPTLPSVGGKFPRVLDLDDNEITPSNMSLFPNGDQGAFFTGTKPESATMVIAISASLGGAVFFALLGCLIYVIIRGKAKKFEEMANSDSSGSSKGHTEVCSQNGMEIGTDTTGSDVEKTPMDSYNHQKSCISPSAIRPNAASTYLLDESYHSPYGTYKHWTAPEPGIHDLYNEVGVDYDGEGDYTEALRRTAMQSLMPSAHSPSPLRPIPNHITYEPVHKTSMLSTFHGQHIPTYRAEALVDELKGHLV